MCEGNQKGLTDRIWVDHFIHTFLHILICVCEKVHICTDTYVGGMCKLMCTGANGGQTMVPRVLSTYSGVGWRPHWPAAY